MNYTKLNFLNRISIICYNYRLNIVIIFVCGLFLIFSSGCLSERGNDGRNIRITIDSLKDKTDNQLADEIIEYQVSHPEELDYLMCYLLNTREMQMNAKLRISKESGDQLILNTIPVVGGFIVDYLNEDFLDEYKGKLLEGIEKTPRLRNDALEGVIQIYVKQGSITPEDATRFFKEHQEKGTINDEAYNTMIKIAALFYREAEAVIDDSKARGSLDTDILDVIDIFTYEVFFKEENKEKIQSFREAFNKIADSLGLLMVLKEYPKFSFNDWMNNYYGPQVPSYLYPYKIKQSYDISEDRKRRYNHSLTDEERKQLYGFVNGNWYSLKNKETVTIHENPIIDMKGGRNYAIGYIQGAVAGEPFGTFRFTCKNLPCERVLITPATYIKDDETTEDVLVMYTDYKLNDSNGISKESPRMELFEITNIRSANDVLVKRANDNGSFVTDFDPMIYAKLHPKKYLMSENLVNSFFPRNKNEFIFTSRNLSDYKTLYPIFNGVWTSLKSGDNFVIDLKIKEGSIGEIVCMSKTEQYAIFSYIDTDIPGFRGSKKVFITPAVYVENGENKNVLLAYINYNLIENIVNDAAPITVYNWRVENIKNAEDVWIKKE